MRLLRLTRTLRVVRVRHLSQSEERSSTALAASAEDATSFVEKLQERQCQGFLCLILLGIV